MLSLSLFIFCQVPSIRDLDKYPYGSRITVRMEKSVIKGELIGVEGDEVFILHEGKLVSFPREKILNYKIGICNYRRDAFMCSAINLGVSTLFALTTPFTNGWFAIITGPLWLGTGIVTGIFVIVSNPCKEKSNIPWQELYKYSRYPQGIPSEIKETVEKY